MRLCWLLGELGELRQERSPILHAGVVMLTTLVDLSNEMLQSWSLAGPLLHAEERASSSCVFGPALKPPISCLTIDSDTTIDFISCFMENKLSAFTILD